MLYIYQLNTVRNERLNFMAIITEDIFHNISVNKRRLQNNGFHNTHLISEYTQNPNPFPHLHSAQSHPLP
jgi:hypothetical protein